MKLATKLSALAFGAFATTGWSFDIHTHTAMTTLAIEQSKLGLPRETNEVLTRIGLRDAGGALAERHVGQTPRQCYRLCVRSCNEELSL